MMNAYINSLFSAALFFISVTGYACSDKDGILPPDFKPLMNKPETSEKPMPAGEFGVVNDYGPRQRVQPGTKRDMENKMVDILQWDMPKPLV